MLIASSQVKLTLFWTVSFTDWEKNPRWFQRNALGSGCELLFTEVNSPKQPVSFGLRSLFSCKTEVVQIIFLILCLVVRPEGGKTTGT